MWSTPGHLPKKSPSTAEHDRMAKAIMIPNLSLIQSSLTVRKKKRGAASWWPGYLLVTRPGWGCFSCPLHAALVSYSCDPKQRSHFLPDLGPTSKKWCIEAAEQLCLEGHAASFMEYEAPWTPATRGEYSTPGKRPCKRLLHFPSNAHKVAL